MSRNLLHPRCEGRCMEAMWSRKINLAAAHAYARTHTEHGFKWLKKKKTGSQQRFKVDLGEIGEPVVISDALVVDCALTGLLPPAPPANPAFPVRPLAQTAGHANTLSPLMFSREGGEKKKKKNSAGLRFSRSTAPPCGVWAAVGMSYSTHPCGGVERAAPGEVKGALLQGA